MWYSPVLLGVDLSWLPVIENRPNNPNSQGTYHI
jgi:hypothetical protein